MNLEKARYAQQRLAKRLRLLPLSKPINLVGGADFAYDFHSGRVGAALVVVHISSLEIVDEATATVNIPCPYIPGFLCFREGPAFFRALRRLSRLPDVWFIDGNGIAHPERMGLASYIGVIAQIATIGCAKTAFFPYEMPAPGRGNYTSYFNHRGEKVGVCLRTRSHVRPVFISPGNLIDSDDSLRLTLELSRFRLPEPLRLAHLRASRIFHS